MKTPILTNAFPVFHAIAVCVAIIDRAHRVMPCTLIGEKMTQFTTVQTTEGSKTLLRSHQEQRDYAKQVDSGSLYCLLPHPEGWFVEMVVDSYKEADEWWEKQEGLARVYYGKSGAIRHSQ